MIIVFFIQGNWQTRHGFTMAMVPALPRRAPAAQPPDWLPSSYPGLRRSVSIAEQRRMYGKRFFGTTAGLEDGELTEGEIIKQLTEKVRAAGATVVEIVVGGGGDCGGVTVVAVVGNGCRCQWYCWWLCPC